MKGKITYISNRGLRWFIQNYHKQDVFDSNYKIRDTLYCRGLHIPKCWIELIAYGIDASKGLNKEGITSVDWSSLFGIVTIKITCYNKYEYIHAYTPNMFTNKGETKQ